MITPYSIEMSFVQDSKLAREYIGQDLSTLPVPSFVVDRDKLRNNCRKMLDKIDALGIQLRVHVKTLKCTPVVREALGNGQHSSVVASTLEDIRHLMSLVEEAVVKDVLYGVPVGKSWVKELMYLRNLYKNFGATLHLLIDHPDQLDLLLNGIASREKWSVFVKVDVDDHRAGAPVESLEFKTMINCMFNESKYSRSFIIHGFYAHAGTSYSSRSDKESQTHLQREITGVLRAAEQARSLFKGNSPRPDSARLISSSPPKPPSFTLSVGSTPTAHSMCKQILNDPRNQLHPDDVLELHAGNFVALDLQQVGTSLVDKSDIAGTIITEICSYYPSRNEYLINAGVLALSREQGPLPGIAHIQGNDDWIVARVSQEHGIVAHVGGPTAALKLPWKLGDRLRLYPQHTCIASSCHRLYFVTDGANTIVDVWSPWRYW